MERKEFEKQWEARGVEVYHRVELVGGGIIRADLFVYWHRRNIDLFSDDNYVACIPLKSIKEVH